MTDNPQADNSKVRFKFGELVENGWAGDENPVKVTMFLRMTKDFIYTADIKSGRELKFYNDGKQKLQVVGKYGYDAALDDVLQAMPEKYVTNGQTEYFQGAKWARNQTIDTITASIRQLREGK